MPAAIDPPELDLPVRYIDRTHAWYAALGFSTPYRYACFADVPFAAPRVPMREACVALLTTAARYDPALGAQDRHAPYNAAAKFYAVYSGDAAVDHDLRVSHVSVDRLQLTDDSSCWFPLPALRRAARAGRIGRVAARFHGVPTNRSQRHTVEVDAPEVLARCREDGVDAAILVANCPVCHQSMSLVARHLEAAGIATVVMGAAKDIVEACGVPRFVFSDFPLGNAAARPDDPASRDATLALAIETLERAFAPRTTVQNPLRWNGRPDWKRHVLDASSLTPQEIERRIAETREIKRVSHAIRDATVTGG